MIRTPPHLRRWLLRECLYNFQFSPRFLQWLSCQNRILDKYLDMLQLLVYAVLMLLQPNVVFQPERAPPHSCSNTRHFYTESFLKVGLVEAVPQLGVRAHTAELFLLGIYKLYCLQYASPWHKRTDDTDSRCDVDHHWRIVGQYLRSFRNSQRCTFGCVLIM